MDSWKAERSQCCRPQSAVCCWRRSAVCLHRGIWRWSKANSARMRGSCEGLHTAATVHLSTYDCACVGQVDRGTPVSWQLEVESPPSGTFWQFCWGIQLGICCLILLQLHHVPGMLADTICRIWNRTMARHVYITCQAMRIQLDMCLCSR